MAKGRCTIDGCDAPRIARGWCHRHYKRWQTHGAPTGIGEDRGPQVGTPEERFFAKIVKVDGCWIWQGTKIPKGYGLISRDGKRQYAHRWAYEHFTGNLIPAGLQIDHLCRRPSCVNPDHLEPVTQIENMRRGGSPPSLNGRKTHCPRSHEYTPENTYISRGRRQCRQCGAIKAREKRRLARALT